jgi:adenosylmethionine-8-amino-7-oxononanoate aminotransferase
MEGRTTVLPTSVKFMTAPPVACVCQALKDRFHQHCSGQRLAVVGCNGRQYIDAIGSLWYCQVGHGRTEIAEAVAAQISTLETYSTFDPFTNQKADELAAKLQSISALPNSRVFLCGSGSEAVDTAMKLARVAQAKQATQSAPSLFRACADTTAQTMAAPVRKGCH